MRIWVAGFSGKDVPRVHVEKYVSGKVVPLMLMGEGRLAVGLFSSPVRGKRGWEDVSVSMRRKCGLAQGTGRGGVWLQLIV